MKRKSLKKHKKGSHVGIIVSFTLFITAIIFLYSMLGPSITVGAEKEKSIYALKTNFLSSASEEIVIVRAYGNGSCINFPKPANVDSGAEVFAISDGSEIGASISGGNILISSFSGLAKVYFTNNSITKSLTEAGPCAVSTANNIVYEDKVMENKIITLVNESITNESKIRSDLRILNDDEFNLIFIYPNGTEYGDRKREVKSNIYARQFKIDYIAKDGIEEYGTLEVRVW